jgi:hypothetical protein
MANSWSVESEGKRQQDRAKNRRDSTVKAAVISSVIAGVAAIVAAIITVSDHSSGDQTPQQAVKPVNQPPVSQQPVNQPLSSPPVQEERVVELSTQAGNESVDIDWWRQLPDKSGDLQMDQHGIYTVLGAKLSVIENSPELTYTRCAGVQDWTSRVDFRTLREGSQFCAQSRMGRYAMLQVRALPWSPRSDGRFVFYGRTWELAP